MSKFITLLKASMTEGMSIFRLRVRGQSKAKKTAVLVALVVMLAMAIYSYADMMLEPLSGTGLEYSVLTIFALVTVLFVLVEGLYKASGLLFNCRDDNLVLALPIKKSAVFLLRITKFYLFETAISALILVPAMVAYVVRVGVGMVPESFYVASLFALVLLPVVPVIISVLIAMGISGVSARFRFKNLVQIVLTTVALIVVLILSFNIQNIMMTIAEHASSINETITRLYYPVGAYIQMVTKFSAMTLAIFVSANVVLAAVFSWAFSKVYFRINSRAKVVKVGQNTKEGKIKVHGVMKALMIKEARRFVTSPVFIINAGFSLVLYIIAVVVMTVNFDGVMGMVSSMAPAEKLGISSEVILGFMPAVVTGLIVFLAMMTSITSSMISLEGKTINILKSMPVTAFKIVIAKVLTAVLIVVPVFLVGDVILFAKFDFSVGQMLIVLALSVVVPIVAEVLGIIVNLKYPKMDAENDTEVVKQSMSSMIAVFGGMIMAGVTAYIIYTCIENGTSTTETMGVILIVYTLLMVGLVAYLKLMGEKEFNKISV